MTNRVLWLALALPVVAAVAQNPAAASVRYGITKSKDSVTIGEPFEVRVRIRAPTGSTIRFPENPDTSGAVQSRDPRVILVLDTTQALDLTAVYRVAAWDVGHQPIRLDDIVLDWSGGQKHVPLDTLDVFVRSVLPADTALRVPKPARPLWEVRPFPWWLIALLLAAVATALGIWWWMRRRRRVPPPVVIDPYVRALREFNRIESMGLVDAGERTRFVALAAEVVRDYLAARFADATLALTSRELVSLVRKYPSVPVERLSRVLHEVDLAKFAGWALTEERARSLAREARAIVEQEHKASQPPAQAAA